MKEHLYYMNNMSVTIVGEAFVDVIFPWVDSNPGETHFRKISSRVGGNAFIATQISNMGEKTNFLGKMGNDFFGNYILDYLIKNNVHNLVSIENNLRTGFCISMTSDKGERTIIADRGANDSLSSEEINCSFNEIIKSNVIYFSGYSLLNKDMSNNILDLLSKIKKMNFKCDVIFNPGAPNIAKPCLQEMITKYVDILILNNDEAQNLTEKRDQEQMFKILEMIAKTIIVTKGNLGCTIITNKCHVNIDTESMNVKDTTGAGDAFSAGFIVGFLRGLNLSDSAKLGNNLALNHLKAKPKD